LKRLKTHVSIFRMQIYEEYVLVRLSLFSTENLKLDF